MRIGRRVLTVAGLALALALVSTCSSPFSLLGTLTTEVKVATGKFLVVTSVTPQSSAEEVNPGVRIAIVFDRALDVSTAIASNIIISPLEAFELDPPEYNALSKTLYVQADPFLKDDTDYTVQLTKGLRGADGSELQDVYVWSFRTGKYPAGSVNICRAGQTTKAEATNNKSVNLKFTWNSEVTQLRYGYTLDLSAISWGTPGDWGIVLPAGTKAVNLDDFNQGTTDGPYIVYVQFRGTKGESEVGNDTIILDMIPPTASPGGTRYINIANSATGVTPTATASDGSGSGIAAYEWSDPYNVGLIFSSTSMLTPTINISTDGTYTARLVVKDKADNWSANCDVTIKRDTVRPVVTFNVDQSEYAYWWNISPHPTVNRQPTWKWTASEIGTFDLILTDYKGNTMYRDEKYKETSYKFSKLFEDNLYYTVTITERDNAGNWSLTTTDWSFLVTPMIPMNKSSNVPWKNMCLQWREVTGAVKYTIKSKQVGTIDVATNRYPEVGLMTIPAGEYEWRYTAFDIKGNTLYESPIYSFATVK